MTGSAKRMFPSQSREPVEVGVRRDHCASVLDGDGGMLRVRHQLSCGPGTAAEVLEDLEVVGPWMNDTSVGPADQLTDEGKDLIMG